VSVFEAGVGVGHRAGASRFAGGITEAGPRIGRAADLLGRAHSARLHEEGFFKRAGHAVGAFFRLLIPVLLLVTLGGASFVYAGTPAVGFEVQPWLNIGYLVLPFTFLAVHLTGRRYGAGYAFGQVILAYALAAGVAFYARDELQAALGEQHGSLRIIIGFGAGLFIAHLVAIFLFDRLRGPRWWQAPLIASLIGGIVLCLIAFPAAYSGTEIDWTGRMLDYMAVTSVAAALLVIPYWVMRPLVPPRSGFGGY